MNTTKIDLNLMGTTYSVVSPNIYENYKNTGDGELFEKLVTDLILNKYSDDLETNEYILSLPKGDQRMAILSLVDKDTRGDSNLLWSEMKAYVDSNRNNKIEHIKDIIKIINRFVKDGDIEKKKFGEVMTPISLVREMLDTLPKEVWSNPDLKWLDPANGAGTFPFVLICNLMNGLKKWEEDPEKRYKHIVENMIYTCELQSRNVFLWMCGVDPYDEYTTNTYWGSFLEEGFDYHMKNVWGVEKFDIVIGNPPYQRNDGGGNGSSATPIYNIFIEKILPITKYLMFIIPSRWMAGGRGLNEFRRMMTNSKKIEYLKDIKSNVFENTEISGGVCYFLWNENYNGFCKWNDDENLKDLSDFDVVVRNEISIQILNKVLKKSDIFFNLKVLPQKPFNMRSNFDKWVDIKDGIATVTRNGIKYADSKYVVDKFNILDKYKVLISKADGAAYNSGRIISKYIIAKPGEAVLETYLVCGSYETHTEAENAGEYLLTKFSRFMLSLRLISQNNSSDKFKWVPYFDFKNKYSDDFLFDYFNISDYEKNFIYKNII